MYQIKCSKLFECSVVTLKSIDFSRHYKGDEDVAVGTISKRGRR